MLSTFKDIVSELYMDWEDCLMHTLKPWDRTYFESICLRTATEDDLARSLYKLTHFLSQKFGEKVIVLIDEYEVPNDWAYEHGYFKEVRSLFPSL